MFDVTDTGTGTGRAGPYHINALSYHIMHHISDISYHIIIIYDRCHTHTLHTLSNFKTFEV